MMSRVELTRPPGVLISISTAWAFLVCASARARLMYSSVMGWIVSFRTIFSTSADEGVGKISTVKSPAAYRATRATNDDFIWGGSGCAFCASLAASTLLSPKSSSGEAPEAGQGRTSRTRQPSLDHPRLVGILSSASDEAVDCIGCMPDHPGSVMLPVIRRAPRSYVT